MTRFDACAGLQGGQPFDGEAVARLLRRYGIGPAEQAALGLPLAEEEGTARRTAHTVASAAADFAAKEAFLKAAGTGLREPFSLCEIEAVRLPGGAPAYHFSGRSAQWVEARRLRAHLSLSHEDGMAMAYCILETET